MSDRPHLTLWTGDAPAGTRAHAAAPSRARERRLNIALSLGALLVAAATSLLRTDTPLSAAGGGTGASTASNADGRELPAVAAAMPAANDGVLHPNDLTTAAGTLHDGVLTIALETRVGSWYPEGDGSLAADSMVGLAEPGKPAYTPAPLMRMPRGTVVRGTLRNTLPRPLTVFGLGPTRSLSDSLIVPVGQTASFSFTAEAVGTYAWWLKSSKDGRFEDLVATGVIAVDEAGLPPGRPRDRILALTTYFTLDSASSSGLGRSTMAVNGRSWPHTERLAYTEGDSVHWQVINLTVLDHPMHLHGFYFRVNGVTANGVDTAYTAAQQRMAVTEVLQPYNAMRMSFVAERPGNWVFHCHYAVHLSPRISSMDTHNGSAHPEQEAKHPSDMPHHMAGLVMALAVAPKTRAVAPPAPSRFFRLEQHERQGHATANGSMGYTLTERGSAVKPTPFTVPAPPLILERGRRVEVNIVNRSTQHGAVHWHGIELESASDGVPGVSGHGANVMPMIHPGDSLAVRWTPPRAGSFMYHAHANESVQMGAGLYGPIIVLEPGERFDAEHDRVLFFGTDGELVNVIRGPFPTLLLNGSASPPPMTFRAGQRYRLRFFNLAGDFPTLVTLEQHGKPVAWRALAKDGYPLPRHQAIEKPASLFFEPGEIYDFEFAPLAAGTYSLTYGLPPGPPGSPATARTTVAVVVR